MEEYKEFSFFGGKVKFKQPKKHRLSIIELLFVDNLRVIKRSSKVLDLGAGFGALSILTALKFGCQVHALERDPVMIELLEYNVKINELGSHIKVIKADLRDYQKVLRPSYFECVVANPPFYAQHSTKNPYHFETDTKLEDFINCAYYSLKDKGYFNLLLPTVRLNEVFKVVFVKNFTPVYVRFFHTKENKSAKLARIVFKKNAESQITVEKPLIINTSDGGYTPEVQYVANFMI